MSKLITLKEGEPKYVYMVIPASYICVYHSILKLLADYGEQMLKDCKATCTHRNSGVIECWNMFNAAVAAYNLGKGNENSNNMKLSKLLISYVTAKIKQIDKGITTGTIVFPVDENGRLDAVVSCGENPIFRIDSKDMELYEHLFNADQDEHFFLGPEDGEGSTDETQGTETGDLNVTLVPYYELGKDGKYHPCADITVINGDTQIDLKDCIYDLYFDGYPVIRFDTVTDLSTGSHTFSIVLTYKGTTVITERVKVYEIG